MPRLWFEVRIALSRLSEVELGGIGVDAWGVDYALLGERGDLVENPYHYRDRRTEGVMEDVLRTVGKEEIYNATGIQFMPINTLYQLVAAQRRTPKLLGAAKRLLTIPDLFNYWLTGNAVCEFTNATTTQMVDPTGAHVGHEPDAAPRTPGEPAGADRRAGLDPRHTPARNCRSFLSCRHDGDRPSLPRHRLRGSCRLCSRGHRISQLRYLVSARYGARFSGDHVRSTAPEFHQ